MSDVIESYNDGSMSALNMAKSISNLINPSPFGKVPILDGFRRLLKMKSNEQNVNEVIEFKNSITKLYDLLSFIGSDKKSYDVNSVRLADLEATRNLYGDYSAGYTINADARIPAGYVNGGNSGNSNHHLMLSIDAEIDDEFNRRYPMLEGEFINIGVKMAMLGYDMYYAHLNDYSTNIVLLNRAILNMSDDTIKPDSTLEDRKNIVTGGK